MHLLISLEWCNAAVVIWKAGETVKVEEIKVDPPKAGEVRIKMLFASVCHTDILYRDGFQVLTSQFSSFPLFIFWSSTNNVNFSRTP